VTRLAIVRDGAVGRVFLLVGFSSHGFALSDCGDYLTMRVSIAEPSGTMVKSTSIAVAGRAPPGVD
jgi:hypothetical protein